MTEAARHFPRSTRAALVAALLALSSVATTVAGAAPSKEQVERARARLERIEVRLGEIQEELGATQRRLNEAAARVELRQIAVERITIELVRTQEEIDRARARYDRISGRLNDRAVEAYMTGPASSIDFLLNADTVADLTDRLAYVDALARADADLAAKVANLKNRLTAFEARLEVQQRKELQALEQARAQERAVAALFDEQQDLLASQERLVRSAEHAFKRTKEDYAEWLEEQRAAQGNALGGRAWDGGSLAPFERIFDVCPVAQPRAYGDGFGAPRYGGGYHLHKGVDIVAPSGTQILAPFDGQAYTSSNSLGGYVVFVVGALGTVYNAHLSSYSESSNSSVSAGEVIGYVGSTGSSSTPHDHFEFHPHSMPGGSWYGSSYGYGVVEDAINPYPMLIQACG
ncbi:MAG: murein hydrolase activator EnvC family protein [Actinomycetota bacterium]